MADPEVEVGGAAPKRRTFRKFAFRGVDLDQLLDMGTDELVKIFTARARRRFQRGLKRKPMALIKKLRKAGRLSVSDIINFSNSEISSRPEGILRSWESSTSLVNVLKNEGKCQFDAGQLSFRGKQVLELSCGHVLPGIFACLKAQALLSYFRNQRHGNAGRG